MPNFIFPPIFQVYEETEKLKADVSSYVQASSAKSNEKLLTDNYVKLNVAKMLSNNTKMYFSGGDSVLGASLSKIFGGVVNPNQKMCYLHTNILHTKKYDKSVNQISPNTYAIFMMLFSIKVPTVYVPTFR